MLAIINIKQQIQSISYATLESGRVYGMLDCPALERC